MLDFFSPVLLWFITGVILLGIELAAPAFVLFFFGVGAWCTSLTMYALPGLSLSNQILIFLVASLCSLVLLRTSMKKIFMGRSSEPDILDGILPNGATALVIEDIRPPALGRIEYSGSSWPATADEPISSGTVVRLLSQQGLTYKVALPQQEG